MLTVFVARPRLGRCLQGQGDRARVFRSDSLSHVSRAQQLCESQGGRPGLPVPNSPYGLCVKVKVAVLGSPSLTVLMVSV